jgi:hypothetical protein
MVAASKTLTGADAALTSISIHEVYPLEIFKQKAGLAGWALQRARRNGLPVSQVGRRRYVRGCDFADYLGRLSGVSSQMDLASVGQA